MPTTAVIIIACDATGYLLKCMHRKKKKKERYHGLTGGWCIGAETWRGSSLVLKHLFLTNGGKGSLYCVGFDILWVDYGVSHASFHAEQWHGSAEIHIAQE